MRFVTGLALTLGVWGLLCAFFAGFILMVFWITSFIPLIGKKHRHDRWEEFNKVRRRVDF
jgi:hypothetical protein